MKSDIEIARSIELKKIKQVAEGIGIPREEVENYGRYIAKIPEQLIDEEKVKKSNLILVTAITATKAGIGKTTVSIGLALGLNKIGKNAIVALREPSLGPCFGMKGGAAGGGYAQVLPMDKINLHFTGDFHAITSAHNMISAQGMGVVFISSEMEEVVRLSDDIEVLKDRHKIAELVNDNTVSQETIVQTIANTNVNTGKEA